MSDVSTAAPNPHLAQYEARGRKAVLDTDGIWNSRYLHRDMAGDELFAPLPDVPAPGPTNADGEGEPVEHPDDALWSKSSRVSV